MLNFCIIMLLLYAIIYLHNTMLNLIVNKMLLPLPHLFYVVNPQRRVFFPFQWVASGMSPKVRALDQIEPGTIWSKG